jgi:hypothetical protein
VYAWRNEKDKAFEWLDRAYAQRDWGLSALKGELLFRNLFRDPRWTVFLREKLKARRIDPTTGRAGMRNDSEPGGPERLPDHSRPRVVSLILFGRDGRPAAVVAPQVDDRL